MLKQLFFCRYSRCAIPRRDLKKIPAAPAEKAQAGRKLKAGAAPATLVFNMSGAPYTEDGIALELRKLVQTLHQGSELPRANFDLHGLRHTRGLELAQSGCTDAEGTAALDHSSASSFAQYRRQANRIKMSNRATDKVVELRKRTQNAGGN